MPLSLFFLPSIFFNPFNKFLSSFGLLSFSNLSVSGSRASLIESLNASVKLFLPSPSILDIITLNGTFSLACSSICSMFFITLEAGDSIIDVTASSFISVSAKGSAAGLLSSSLTPSSLSSSSLILFSSRLPSSRLSSGGFFSGFLLVLKVSSTNSFCFALGFKMSSCVIVWVLFKGK